jgi:hypothetical protein
MVMLGVRIGSAVPSCTVIRVMAVGIRLDIVVVDLWVSTAWSRWGAHVVFAVTI